LVEILKFDELSQTIERGLRPRLNILVPRPRKLHRPVNALEKVLVTSVRGFIGWTMVAEEGTPSRQKMSRRVLWSLEESLSWFLMDSGLSKTE
jgi:hypothetical protein